MCESTKRQMFLNDIVELMRRHKATLYVDWDYAYIILPCENWKVSFGDIEDAMRHEIEVIDGER